MICVCYVIVMGCGVVDNKIFVSYVKGNLIIGIYECIIELFFDWVCIEIEYVKKSLLKVRFLRIFYWLLL